MDEAEITELMSKLQRDAEAVNEVKNLAHEVLGERDDRRKRAERTMNVLQALILAAILGLAGAFVGMRDTVNRLDDWAQRTEANRFRPQDALQLERRLEAVIRQELREHLRDHHGAR